MTKGKFDSRTWVEIVSNLVSERTSPGDSIKLIIQYRGNERPQIWLNFMSYDTDKKVFNGEEELTDWLPEAPYYEIIDDSTGQPLSGDTQRGSTNWRDYMDTNFGPLLQSIVKTGGRIFSFEVK